MQIRRRKVWQRRFGVRRAELSMKTRALFLILTAAVFTVGTIYVPSSPDVNAALPGADWTQRNPGSVVKYWNDIASSDDGTKLAVVAGDDYIYTSNNSGASWTRQQPLGAGITKRWRTIASSADGTRLVAAADDDYVYTSTNSGASWTPRYPAGAGNAKVWPSVASSADGMTLMAGASDYVYLSTDGGVSWSPSYPAGAGIRAWSSVAMSNDSAVMYAGTDSGYIYTSNNGGTSWSQLDPAGAPRYWSDIAVSADGTKLVAVARNDYVYTSVNSGANWTQNIIGGSTQYWAGADVSDDGSVMLVSSGSGHIYRSTDTGSTWTQRDPANGSRNWAGAALSADGTKAAISALTDYVYTSINTGDDWTQRDPVGSARYWTAMASSADGMTLFAGAQGDYLYKSTDGGETWTQVRATGNNTAAWVSIDMSTDGTRIVAAEQIGSSGMIWTSDDGGSTWTMRNPGGSAINWWSVSCSADCRNIVATSGWDSASGSGGYVYTSDDFGDNWETRQPAGATTYSWYGSAVTADGGKMVVSAGGNYIYSSSDGGATWTRLDSAGATGWYRIAMSSDGQRLVAGTSGAYVHTSSDGGATWTERRPDGNNGHFWRDVDSSADGMRLIIAGQDDYVYTSADGGENWSKRDPAGGTRNWRAVASSANGARLAAAATNDYIYTSGGSFLPTVDPSEISVLGGTVNLIGECSATNDYPFASVISEGDTTHAISYDGVVYSWGSNVDGKFGNGTTTNSSVPVAVDTSGVLAGKTITKIVATSSSVSALASDGTIYSWGINNYGQLGDGTNDDSNVPVAVNVSGVLSGKTVLQLFGEGDTIYALTSDGTIYSWGRNNYGQLGNSTTVSSNVPVAVDASGVLSGKTIKQIAADGDTAYALASDGTIYSWGHNDYGQLGNGGTTISPTWTQHDPAGLGAPRHYIGAAMSADGTTIAVAVQYGPNPSSIYISTDSGATWTGRGTPEGLPRGVAYHDIKISADGQNMITSVSGNYIWTSIDGGVSWTQQATAGANVTGSWRSVDITSDGTKAVAVNRGGYIYTGALNGGVWSWTQRGSTQNWFGVAMSDDGNKIWANTEGGLVYFSVDSGATWTANSPRPDAGGTASWGRIDMSADGTKVITASRDAGFGRVYTTANAGTATPATWTQRDPTGSGTGLTWFGVASSDDGTKLMAGLNAGAGPVYTSTNSGATWTGHSSLPSGGWRSMAMSSSGDKMVAADFSLDSDSGGYVYTYPTITSGGGNVDSSVPVAVDTSGILSGKSISQIFTGYQTAYAIAADGSIYAWGEGGDGQLGNGSTVDSNAPVAVDMTGVMSGKKAKQISAYDNYAFAIATDGTVYSWGRNPDGRLGNGTTTDSSFPTSVVGALAGKNITNIVSNDVPPPFAGGDGVPSVYALALDGTVYSWGYGDSGQLGNGADDDSYTPVAVKTDGVLSGKFVTNIASSTATNATGYALASDGLLYSWGYNFNGTLGNGTAGSGADSNVPVAVAQSSPIASITVDGKAATNIVSPDGCTVSFTAPPNDAGTYDVVVTYADGTIMTILQSLTYLEPYIMLFLYGDNLITADPFKDDGVGTTPLQTTVVTNDTTGYTVSLNAVDTTDLACTESGRGSDIVPAMSGSGSSMTDDTWAYGLGTSVATPGVWDGITTTATVFDSYNADTAGRTHHLYFGAKVTTNTTPCSNYEGDVLLTATTNWGSMP